MPDSINIGCVLFDISREIEAARSISQLHSTGVRMIDTLKPSISRGADTRSIVQIISGLNDAITMRLIALLDNIENISLPDGAAFLVLGSEGRGEQTLRTDQDNAIVYIDDLSSDKRAEVVRFAGRIVAALEEVGVPLCPGNIMARNPHWCHSISEWKELLDQWVSAPTPENMLNFGMLQDFRSLHGDENLGVQLRDSLCSAVHRHTVFFPNMAGHVVRFPPPFTIFGRMRVECDGEHKGKVDLKKAGIFAISAGASLLALESGVVGGTTWSKLEFLGKQSVITPGDLARIENAFTFLTRLRLQQQLSADSNPSNCVDLQSLPDEVRSQFRQALKGVKTFIWIFRNHYHLDFYSI